MRLRIQGGGGTLPLASPPWLRTGGAPRGPQPEPGGEGGDAVGAPPAAKRPGGHRRPTTTQEAESPGGGSPLPVVGEVVRADMEPCCRTVLTARTGAQAQGAKQARGPWPAPPVPGSPYSGS